MTRYEELRLETSFVSHGSIDVGEIRRRLDALNPEYWSDAVSQNFDAHAMADHVFLINDIDARHDNGTRFPLYGRFIDALAVLVRRMPQCLGSEGHLIRLQFARLGPGAAIRPHTDKTVTLIHSHRIHVPIVSNPACEFECGGETVVMKEGEVWDFDNTRLHAVRNEGNSPRIHLILDWALPLPLSQWPRYAANRLERVWRGYAAKNRQVIQQAREVHARLAGGAG